MKQQPTEKEIQEAKQGSEPALAAIIAKKMPLIRHMAQRAKGPGLDFDDAVQEGLIGLFHAIESYKPDQGTLFSTYSSVCIQNSIVSAKRAAGRKKHAPLNHSVPIPEEESIPGPEEQAIATEQVTTTLAKAKKNLSPLELKVLRLLLLGYGRKEIAVALNKGEKSVDNALLRLRRKLC